MEKFLKNPKLLRHFFGDFRIRSTTIYDESWGLAKKKYAQIYWILLSTTKFPSETRLGKPRTQRPEPFEIVKQISMS